MRPLDRPVLVGHAAIVARDRHAVMGAQRPVALGHVVRVGLGEVAEGRRQTVGAVVAGRAAEMPERALQPFRQRREALAAEHHLGVGEARPGQAEVVEHVIERLTGDGHAKRAHVGEVRQALPARLMLLAEDHVLLGTVLCAPAVDPPFQGAPDARVQIRMSLHQLLEHAHGADLRTVLQDRHHLGLEDVGQRVRPTPAPRRRLPGRQGRIRGEPVARGAAEARLCRRGLDRVGLLQGHEKPHLVIVDVAARHPSLPSSGKLRG